MQIICGLYQQQDASHGKQPQGQALAFLLRPPAGVMPPEPSAADYPFVSPDRPDSEAPHFVAEMFFLTQVSVPWLVAQVSTGLGPRSLPHPGAVLYL